LEIRRLYTVSFLGIHKWEPDIYIGFLIGGGGGVAGMGPFIKKKNCIFKTGGENFIKKRKRKNLI
jgi:hypothetical protein